MPTIKNCKQPYQFDFAIV